jgi:lipopolysaccharide export system protein LptA
VGYETTDRDLATTGQDARMCMKKIVEHVGWVFILTIPVLGQPREGKPITLNHADSLVGKVIDGETVREVIGNVEFQQEDVRIQCDRAVYYPRLNRADLFGNVRVFRDTLSLRAPRGMYDGEKKQAFGYDGIRLRKKQLVITARKGRYQTEEKIAYFETDVKVVDSATTITSRELTYYETEHRSLSVGDVKVVNSKDNATMYGDHLEHFDDTRYSKMIVSPRFVQVDTSSSGKIDTLVITSRQMESYEDSVRRFIATDSVQLVRGQLAGKCGLGIFYPDKDLVSLYKDPFVWYEKSQVRGDSIRIQLQKRRLERVLVYGNAFAASQNDSVHQDRRDQLTSQNMTLFFSNDSLKQIVAEGTATSLYFLYDDGKPNGVNRASGDKIFIVSREGHAEDIKILGGTEGKFYPENLVAGSLSSYDLPGFVWKVDRPRLARDLTIVSLPSEKHERSRVRE